MEQGPPFGEVVQEPHKFPAQLLQMHSSLRPAHSSLAKFVPPGRNLPSRCSIDRDPRIMQGLWIETQSPEVQTRPSLHTGANSEDFWRSPVSATLANRLLGSSPDTGFEEIGVSVARSLGQISSKPTSGQSTGNDPTSV